MALKLEDLIAGQKRLEETTQKVETISLEQLKGMTGQNKNEPVLPKASRDDSSSLLNLNISKLIDVIKKNNSLLIQSLKAKSAPVKQVRSSIQNADISEKEIEQQNSDKRMYDLLSKIEKNTRPDETVSDKTKAKSLGDFGIGGLGTLLALALGSVVGIIKGYVATLKVFGIDLEKLTKGIKTSFGTFIGKMSSVLDDALKGLKNLVSVDETSKIGNFFGKITKAIKDFFKPLSEAWEIITSNSKVIGNLVGGIKAKVGAVTGFFDDIAGYLKTFGNLFGGFAKIVSKIALPVMVLMTVWDTIKGAMKGFEDEGIIGGIKGAIKGFVTSLITAPMDMLKNLVSWIAGALGFENIEKTLDSFSFESIFNELVEMIFHPIDTLKSILSSLGNMLANIEIPKFGLELFGAKAEFGPFKPFSGLASTPVAPTQSKQEASGKIRKAQAAAPDVSTGEKVYKESKAVELVKATPAPTSTTSVVSAPTTITKQTKNIAVKQPIRNSDSSLNSYLKSRYST